MRYPRVSSRIAVLCCAVIVACATASSNRPLVVAQVPPECVKLIPVSGAASGGKSDAQLRSEAQAELLSVAAERGATHVVVERIDVSGVAPGVGAYANSPGASAYATGVAYKCPVAK